MWTKLEYSVPMTGEQKIILVYHPQLNIIFSDAVLNHVFLVSSYVLLLYSFISQLSDRQLAKAKDLPVKGKDLLCWVAFIISSCIFFFFLGLRCIQFMRLVLL